MARDRAFSSRRVGDRTYYSEEGYPVRNSRSKMVNRNVQQQHDDGYGSEETDDNQSRPSDSEEDFDNSQQENSQRSRRGRSSSTRRRQSKHPSPSRTPITRRLSQAKRGRSPSQSDDDSARNRENQRPNKNQPSPTLEELARRTMAPSEATKLRNANKKNKELAAQLAALQQQIAANGGQGGTNGGQAATNGGQGVPIGGGQVGAAGVQVPIAGGQVGVAGAQVLAPNGHVPIPQVQVGAPLQQFASIAANNGVGHVQNQQEFQEALAMARSNSKKKKSKKKKDSKWGDTQNVIRDAVRDYGIRRVKFITNDTVKLQMTKIILDYLQIEGLVGDTPEIQKARALWIEAYSDCVKYEWNEARVYINQNIKDNLWSWVHNKNDDKWPTLEQLEACFDRTIDINTPEGFAIMECYWDILVAKGACNKHAWAEEFRHYTTIMEHKVPTLDGKMTHAISTSTEAFTMLCIKNNYSNWKKQYEVKFATDKAYEEFKNMELSVKTAKAWDSLTQDVIEKEDYFTKNGLKKTRVALKGPSFKTLYTDEKGQKSHHGWNEDGMNQLDAYKKKSQDLRTGKKGEATLAFEKAFLAKLRAKLGLTESNQSAQMRANKKAKKDLGAAAHEAAVAAMEEKEAELED